MLECGTKASPLSLEPLIGAERFPRYGSFRWDRQHIGGCCSFWMSDGWVRYRCQDLKTTEEEQKRTVMLHLEQFQQLWPRLSHRLTHLRHASCSLRGTSSGSLLATLLAIIIPIDAPQMFDAIICDPPYGVRAGSKKQTRAKDSHPQRRHMGHYTVGEMCRDLLDFAARMLTTGTHTHDFRFSVIPIRWTLGVLLSELAWRYVCVGCPHASHSAACILL